MTVTTEGSRARLRAATSRAWGAVALPVVSILLALVGGAIYILVSQLIEPGGTLNAARPFEAYRSLFLGAFGNLDNIVETLVQTTPLVLTGLAVAIGFRAGLFNIGAQGQFTLGALGSVIVGVALADQPGFIAITAAVLAGTLVGAIYGFIPGFLKATSGAHEVVTTIMLNYVATSILAALVSGPLKVPNSPSPITRDVGNAAFPILIGTDGHLGLLIALVMTFVIWWLLFRTTRGFEIRTVGANPDAARYAGMRPKLVTTFTMALSGALAGLAGACVVLGVTHQMQSSFATSVGFDAIAVALLARSNPLAILPSALLFGAMRAGSNRMQVEARIPPELINVLVGIALLFLIATPALRWLLRWRSARPAVETSPTIARSYGGSGSTPGVH
ncbi:MAG TPA: ABC transporter permease [Candidatus Limnocylindrales bacterium]|nr:ABC transporter permease [Candidatus Limnocylindrales bacterium]